MRYLISGIIVLGCFIFCSCLNTQDFPTFEEQLAKDIEAIDAYLAARSITAIEHESGLRYVVTQAGSGPKPTLADSIRVTYKGMFLSNGQVFDQSSSPVTFPLNGLITGWQIAFPLLEEGTEATLYIPSGFGYGPGGTIGIPGNSNLIFEVELLEVI